MKANIIFTHLYPLAIFVAVKFHDIHYAIGLLVDGQYKVPLQRKIVFPIFIFSNFNYEWRKKGVICFSNNYHPTASVTAMLNELGWSSLEARRTLTRITLLHKMSRHLIDIDVDLYLQPHTERRTRGSHNYKYRLDKATKNVYFYSFFPRTIRQWNSLPSDIVDENSLDLFKSKLSNF